MMYICLVLFRLDLIKSRRYFFRDKYNQHTFFLNAKEQHNTPSRKYILALSQAPMIGKCHTGESNDVPNFSLWDSQPQMAVASLGIKLLIFPLQDKTIFHSAA